MKDFIKGVADVWRVVIFQRLTYKVDYWGGEIPPSFHCGNFVGVLAVGTALIGGVLLVARVFL